jgi:hypothetical protein
MPRPLGSHELSDQHPEDHIEEPYTVSCPPNRKHHGTVEFAPTDARHPVCPVCGMEVAR